MTEHEHNPRLEQMLESGLSADFRNEYLALWRAAETDDRNLFLSLINTPSATSRSVHGRLRAYRERFHNDSAILAATDREAERQLDDITQRMNRALEQPASADLQQFAGLCQEADDLILGSHALPEAA